MHHLVLPLCASSQGRGWREAGETEGREAQAQGPAAPHIQIRWTWPSGVCLLEKDYRLPKETAGTLDTNTRTYTHKHTHTQTLTHTHSLNYAACPFPIELFCKELLQHENAGSVCCLCHQLHPPLLQGNQVIKLDHSILPFEVIEPIMSVYLSIISVSFFVLWAHLDR